MQAAIPARHAMLALFIVVLITAAAHWSAFSNGYLDFDDQEQVVNNPSIRAIDASTLSRAAAEAWLKELPVRQASGSSGVVSRPFAAARWRSRPGRQCSAFADFSGLQF
jgi:hypothetical protein